MKIKYLYILTLVALLGSSCQENERLLYGTKSALYFANSDGTAAALADSLTYSFRIKDTPEDTLRLRVKLLGALLDNEQPFTASVVADETSAVEGVHYKALQETYVFHQDTTYAEVPIVVYRDEATLNDGSVALVLELNENDQFDVAYDAAARKKIILTNQLIKPVYWDLFFFLYFGDYSQVKHQKCIEIMGHDFPLTEEGVLEKGYSYYMQKGREVAYYYATHEEYDENGNLIAVWNPF